MQDSPSPPWYRRMIISLWIVSVLALIAVFLAPQLNRLSCESAAELRPVTVRGELAADEKRTVDLFRAAAPSVVYITTLARAIDPRTWLATEVPRGTGSGLIWDDQGHVITNFHVIRDATSAVVVLHDRNQYRAALVGTSPDHELAVLRIDAPQRQLRPVPLGTSHDLYVGQIALAIGNPFGLDQTLTTGIVSALGRQIQSLTGRMISEVIQTDTAINPGNSGGPLLDSAGRLIGINTMIASPSGGSVGIGFAIPVDTVNRVVPQLIQHGQYTRPKLGILVHDQLSRDVLRQLGVEGVVVRHVQPNTGAARAGLRGVRRSRDGSFIPGDIIQEIDGLAIRNMDDLFRVLEQHRSGDIVTASILREGRSLEVPIELH